MFSVLPLSFRFRGKSQQLADLYRCFLDHPGVGLHPTQIARHTGIGFAAVSRLLESTPELFVKLPKRSDGITRYRLTSAMAARSEAEVEAFIGKAARKETALLYAAGTMLLCVLLIIAVLVAPAV